MLEQSTKIEFAYPRLFVRCASINLQFDFWSLSRNSMLQGDKMLRVL